MSAEDDPPRSGRCSTRRTTPTIRQISAAGQATKAVNHATAPTTTRTPPATNQAFATTDLLLRRPGGAIGAYRSGERRRPTRAPAHAAAVKPTSVHRPFQGDAANTMRLREQISDCVLVERRFDKETALDRALPAQKHSVALQLGGSLQDDR
jgi:hypothetical protein